MTITFYSNFLYHLQTPFCAEMYNLLNGNFTFVSTMEAPKWILESGYLDCTNYIYNLNSFADDNSYKRALQLGKDSDIVIIGSAPEVFIKERLELNKITFRYSERILKKGYWQLLDPRVLISLLRDHTQYRNQNLYMLCASAYTSNDLDLIFAYPKKKFKWGYITEVEELDIDWIIAQKPKEQIEIIWTGRFIDWKHPELAIKLASELKRKGHNFRLNMIGGGEMVDYIQKLIRKLHVSDCVCLLGSMPNSEVRSYMRKSNIFIFTSDRNEGWGAVLNEAMSCGCAVVASNMIGAAPFLISDNKNGLVFKSGNLSSLLQQTERLLMDKNFRDLLGKNAYSTLTNVWHPKKAAANFIRLSKSILDGQIISIQDGPCSRAERTRFNN